MIKIEMTDGRILDYNDLNMTWAEFKILCENNNIEIKEINVGDYIVEPKADGYFVLNEVTVLDLCNPDTTTYYKYCVGSINLTTNKARYRWYNGISNEYMYTEVRKAEDFLIKELMIKRHKNGMFETQKLQGSS